MTTLLFFEHLGLAGGLLLVVWLGLQPAERWA
jgi:hypothetical protein